MLKISPDRTYPLFDARSTRHIERLAQARLAPHTLMQRAGLAVARLALAVAPHAQRIWIACGPGNNGGDGLEAAIHLQRWGKTPCVTWLGQVDTAPTDAAAAHQRLQAAGVHVADGPIDDADLCIDALLGVGLQVREPEGRLADWIERIHACHAPVLAVDTPSGLNASTGISTALQVRATHTLSLLTLKPGLFTGQGRDACGAVWFDDLGVTTDQIPDSPPATAWLAQAPQVRSRPHASHKGSYGDVAIVGGADGMTGAALLAGQAALHAGAGRVYIGLLTDQALPISGVPAELMFRSIPLLDFSGMAVVCGCGGGEVVQTVLPRVLRTARAAVIDADALNAMASDGSLQTLLLVRSQGSQPTVLTPHPLEAARLLDCTAAEVQQDRLQAACSLSQRLACTVVLKGSGTVIASPGQAPVINPSGNAKLATAGTGDVLAGMIGALMAQGLPSFNAACRAVYRHGEIADQWPEGIALTASQLATRW